MVRLRQRLGIFGSEDLLARLHGHYVFNKDVLAKALDNKHVDFGKHIIPT